MCGRRFSDDFQHSRAARASTGGRPNGSRAGELREETGLDAARMSYAGHLFVAYGYSNQGSHIFVATDLRRGDDNREREEQDLVTQEFPLSDVERMIRGEIKDTTTVAALGLLRMKGLL